MTPPDSFSHIDSDGNIRMVDVSTKAVTRREAEASCKVLLEVSTLERLSDLPKGDALVVARLAGIQGAKRASELVPLAHPLPIEQIEVTADRAPDGVVIRSKVVTTARTGAEIEALTACSVAALALYDMVKAVDRQAVVTDLRLDRKSGGASGDFRRER